MPDRELKHSIRLSQPASTKEQGLYAALEALKNLNSTSFSTEELVIQIAARLRTALKNQCVAIWLLDDLHTKISMKAYACMDFIDLAPKKYFYDLNKPSDIESCLKNNKAVVHKKYLLAENDPRVETLPKSISGALLPLSTAADSLGVMEIITSSEDSINTSVLEYLELVASQVALLIANHQNAERKLHQSSLQKQLYEITNKINQAKDYESILRVTLEEICTTLNLPAASIHVNLAATGVKPESKKETGI
jgi:transcriptional regulator with GAF, ATPase, and Fis domain